MSSLPQITEALCMAVATGNTGHARVLALQAAAKMGAPRGYRIQRAFDRVGQITPVSLNGRKLEHWQAVSEPRAPWVPPAVRYAIDDWLKEALAADALLVEGERVLPLLLAGETRCGKTSSLCAVTKKLGLEVRRLSLADAVGSHLGESAIKMRNAIREAKESQRAVWLIDELDGVAFKRRNGQACEQERSHAVGALLSDLETLPPGLPLVATTNCVEAIDAAVLGRFTVASFPTWADLTPADRVAFASSHGYPGAGESAASYADAVKDSRRYRVAAILARQSSASEPEQALEMVS